MPASTASVRASTRRSLSDLLTEYDQWCEVLEYTTGESDGVEKIVALYRFAIANYDDPRIDLLLDAIATVETAGKDF